MKGSGGGGKGIVIFGVGVELVGLGEALVARCCGAVSRHYGGFV
jgi:hypothetical protein